MSTNVVRVPDLDGELSALAAEWCRTHLGAGVDVLALAGSSAVIPGGCAPRRERRELARSISKDLHSSARTRLGAARARTMRRALTTLAATLAALALSGARPQQADAAVTVLFSSGALIVQGDSANDAITIACQGEDATVNGAPSGGGCGAVTSISVYGDDSSGFGSDTIDLSGVTITDFSSALEGNITIFGGDGSLGPGDAGDVITGSEFSQKIFGEGGPDQITADDGFDTIDGGQGNDQIDAGDGDNVVTGGPGQDIIVTGSGDDVISGDGDGDVISAGDGDDLVNDEGLDVPSETATANDSVDLGPGDDSLTGPFTGSDTVTGGDGDDSINGGGSVLLKLHATGDGGDDTIMGGGADGDVLSGGDGDDSIVAGNGSDQLSGECGNDFLDAQDGSGNADTIFTGNGIDTVLDDPAFDTETSEPVLACPVVSPPGGGSSSSGSSSSGSGDSGDVGAAGPESGGGGTPSSGANPPTDLPGPPRLRNVHMTDTSFGVGPGATPVTTSQSDEGGTNVDFDLTEFANVKADVAKQDAGYRSAPGSGPCKKATDGLRRTLERQIGKKLPRSVQGAARRKKIAAELHKRECKLLSVQAASGRTINWTNLPTGHSHVHWSGRLGRQALRRGLYRMTLVATDLAGNRSDSATITFRIVRSPRR